MNQLEESGDYPGNNANANANDNGDDDWYNDLFESTIFALQYVVQDYTCRQSLANRWYLAGPHEGERQHQELMQSNHARIYENLRMSRHVFLNLCTLLEEKRLLSKSGYISVGQQVHIYIRAMGHKHSSRACASFFQHSKETISRYTTLVMDGLAALFNSYVKLPDPNYVSPRISSDTKYMPFFKNCIGALDGTQIAASVAGTNNTAAFRNRKGFLSQNVLIVCSFDMMYLYVLPGWEGSAHDGLVLSDARANHNFHIPPGKYYLGDAGYALSESVLVPYRGVRYHLKESYSSALRPANAKELFNLRHASLRNVVERQIGVLKKRFPMLTYPSYYPYEKQVKNIYALTMLSNYIQIQDRGDFLFNEHVPIEEHDEQDNETPETLSTSAQARRAAGSKLREQIAKAMWDQYKQVRSRSSRS